MRILAAEIPAVTDIVSWVRGEEGAETQLCRADWGAIGRVVDELHDGRDGWISRGIVCVLEKRS